jgi:tripartite-type tricarboxylate transporter receptor subunit TctC
MAPHSTPDAIVAKLNAAVTAILREPDIRAQFAKLGVRPAPMDIATTARFIDAERARWGEIIRSADVTLE